MGRIDYTGDTVIGDYSEIQADYSACGVCSALATSGSCGAGYRQRSVIQGQDLSFFRYSMKAIFSVDETAPQVGYCHSSSVPFTQTTTTIYSTFSTMVGDGFKYLKDGLMGEKKEEEVDDRDRKNADVSMAANGKIGVTSATSTTATGPSSVCDPKVDGTADQKADHALCCEAIKITS